MPRIPRIVPWTSYEEFETLYQWFYADPQLNQLRERAIKRVRAWASRGRVPHAIECTANFVEVSLRDRPESRPRLSQQELRTMYTMTFIRFVNGIVDPAQRGVFAQSVASIAERLNLPLWFVELRHAGTHEHLPSLQVLRNGCEQALRWLHDNYWTYSLRNGDDDTALLLDNMDEIRRIISKYKDSRKQFLKDLKARQADPSSAKPDLAPAFKALKELATVVSPDTLRDDLIPLLLDVGGLVPMKKAKRPTTPDFTLSEDLLQLWTPLLQRLDEAMPSFAEELVMGMLERLDVEEVLTVDQSFISPVPVFLIPQQSQDDTKSSDPRKSTSYLLTLTAWIQYFIKQNRAPNATASLRSTNTKMVTAVAIFQELQLDDVLEFCLKRPNVYTRALLQILVDQDADLARGARPFMRYIDKVLGVKSMVKRIEDVPSSTDKDLEGELDTLRRHVAEVKEKTRHTVFRLLTPASSNTAWSLYTGPTPWSACPLGCLPDGTVPCLDLPLALDARGEEVDVVMGVME